VLTPCSIYIELKAIEGDLCPGKGHTDWDRKKCQSSKTSIFDNRKNTVEALVNDHLGNSDKCLKLELVAYENGFYHKAFDMLMVTTIVVVIILNKLSLLSPVRPKQLTNV